MRNAGASIDPPTDPSAAVPLPKKRASNGAGAAGEPSEGAGAPRGRKLPPGVSPDIFGRPATPPPGRPGSSGLPPVPPPPQPWPMTGAPERRNPVALPTGPASAGETDDESFGGDPATVSPGPPRRRRGRRFLMTSVVVALVASLAYAVPAVAMSGMVLPGTSVEGVDLGGLTVTQAADRLRERLDGRARQPIAVRAVGVRHEVLPEESGLELDVVGTIKQAPSGFPTPFETLRGLTGETLLEPKITVDSVELANSVERLADDVDRPVREGEIRFDGRKPEIEAPREGRALESAAAATAIQRAYLGDAGPVELPVTVLKPKATAEAFKEAAVTARKAVTGPFTLTHGGRQAQLSAEAVAAHLSFVPDAQGAVRPVFDAKNALTEVEKKLIDPGKAPIEPTYEIVNGVPQLIPGRAGQGVDEDELSAALIKVIEGGGSRTIPVQLVEAKPRIDDADARALDITEKISEFTTEYPCCEPQAKNIQAIAGILDGYVVRPGETFSLNEIVGQRDKARGFVPAPEVVDGRFADEMGGGISQFVTTMYNAVFFAGLRDVKHTAHEFYISRYPAGRESTVSFPQPDFQWENNSKSGVLIKTSATATSITVTFWGGKRYDRIEAKASDPHSHTNYGTDTDAGPDCVPMPGRRGFTIEVTRVFYNNGQEVKRDEPVRTVYRPQTKLTCTNSSADG
ncbi:VanW family protein [Streptosporangium sp. KLBMP 9127]|nr:VanW family protein [Streptosporangium sp. KLBMP 9127]